MTPHDREQTKTIEDFGEQWQLFDDIDYGFYGEHMLFDDLLAPFVRASDIAGKYVADIGSGSGRIVSMLVAAGAAKVMAIEPSAAFEVLRRNTQPIADRLVYLNMLGSEIPAGEYLDYVFSIGVVHHIPDPDPTIAAAFEALRPEGQLVVWLYGREGNRLYLWLVEPLRWLTKRLPSRLVVALAWMLWLPLAIYAQAARILPLPMRRYTNGVVRRLSTRQLVATIYDQLKPAYAKYYTRAEAEALLTRAGFTNVVTHHRHGYSWLVCGTRPSGC